MYKGLIDNLTFVYGFNCKGRGKLSEEDMKVLSRGTRTLVNKAPAVLGKPEEEQAEDRADLAEARKIDEHIEEMTVFLLSLEIV